MKSVLLSRSLMLLAAIILIGAGCKKIKRTENSVTVTEIPSGNPELEAGKGGSASFLLTPMHDGLYIDSCMMYVKYNSLVIPFNGRFDDSAWAVKDKNGVPVGTFRNLKPGNYYVYGQGWDLIRSVKVRGGLPFRVPEERKATAHTLIIQIHEYE